MLPATRCPGPANLILYDPLTPGSCFDSLFPSFPNRFPLSTQLGNAARPAFAIAFAHRYSSTNSYV